MPLVLYAHPFSSYCQKVLVALYENDVPFEYRSLEDPSAMAGAPQQHHYWSSAYPASRASASTMNA